MPSDEDDLPKKKYPVAVSKMSKTPSWVMLGFVLGALFGYAFFKRPAAPAPAPKPPPAAETAPAAEPRTPPPLTRIEAVFEEWGHYATWSNDLAEIALWAPETSAFTDFYEVRRVDGVFYFRTIPKLTRLVIRHGRVIPDCPLQFTETEEQYREWYEHGRTERPIERMWQKPPPAPKPITTTVDAPALKPLEIAPPSSAVPPPPQK